MKAAFVVYRQMVEVHPLSYEVLPVLFSSTNARPDLVAMAE